MIYKIELDATQIQIIGEALATAPMAMRATQPVLNAIQTQINAQEQIAKAVTETVASRTHTTSDDVGRHTNAISEPNPESKRRGRNGAATAEHAIEKIAPIA